MSKEKLNEQVGESYGAFVKRQYNKSMFGKIALYIVAFFALLAVFADFLANDKPIVASLKGSVTVPIVKEYFVKLGITTWSSEEVSRDWKNEKYDWSMFPLIPYAPESMDKNVVSFSERAPNSQHLMGTDVLGRDVLAGIIHGSRYALSIGFVAMGISLVIGIILGALAGYFGGWIDIVISRVIEIVLTLPTFFLIITVVAMITRQEGRLFLIMSVIGLTGWTSIARLVRGEVLRVRTQEFVTAAQALGYSASRTIFVHVLPNSLGPVLVSAAFGVASAILLESALSFLGFGVPPTIVTWGSILNKSRDSVAAWWLAIFPGLMIFLTVLSYNLIGDTLRDATDPRLRS